MGGRGARSQYQYTLQADNATTQASEVNVKGGTTTKERRSFSITGGMCPRCEGTGAVTDFDLTALYDDSKSLNQGALTIPGYSMEGWYGRIYRASGFFDPDQPIKNFTKRQLHDLLYKEPTRIKVEGINLTYEGLIPKITKSMLSKDPEAMQPHVRAFVERAITFQTCPDCGGTRLAKEALSSKIKGRNIAEVVTIGPPLMMRAVSDLTKPYGVKTVASLNSIMVDATGMCGACMVPVNIDGKMVRKHACVDGPEIDSHIIDWDKFLPRFNLFKPQEQASKVKHGLA